MVSLFSASLERHMSAYMDEVKQNQLNQSFQLAQNRILRESQLMNLSQADTMNRLNTLREELIKEMKPSTISLSKTNAPEVKVEEERYIPMTASDYENKINRKPTIKIENRRGLIEELDKKLKSRKKNDIDTLMKIAKNESERASKKATKKVTLFQQELEAKLKKRIQKPPSISDSNIATTESNSASVGLMPVQQNFRQLQAEVWNRLKELDIEKDYNKKDYNSMAKLNALSSELVAKYGYGGNGLKRKNKKKNK